MATVIIIKVTERCNSNCYYCDVVRKAATGGSMSLELMEQLFIRVNEYLQARPEEEVELLWHGGEPLLMGPRYYREVIRLQDKHCAGMGDRIRHAIQTNLTPLTPPFIPILRELGIGAVGTSYDPEPGMRGFGKSIRTDRYNQRFMRALEILEENDIGWGMIYVVTKRTLQDPVGVFHFLTNLRLSGGFNMNPVLVYDEARQDIAVTPREYADFLGAIFPIWWEHRDRYRDVQPFRSFVDTIIDGNLSLGCVDSGACTYHHINVAPDGSTSQCGRSADWGLLDYGNIKDRSLVEILADPQRDELNQRVEALANSECRGCRLWEICHGGCPLDAYSQYQSFMHKSEWCEAKRHFIFRYFEPVTGVRYEPPHGTGTLGEGGQAL